MVKDYYSSVIQAKKGVKEFLEYLKIMNYRIGMATSSNIHLVEAVLGRNNLLEYFDTTVTTCEVPRDKSYPDVFIETAKRLKVNPCKCLVFEDTISGLTGAKAANMKVVAVYDSFGTYSFEELKEASDNLIDNFESIVADYCDNIKGV